MNTGHLTDEQFAVVLAGEPDDAATAHHLVNCSVCRRELETAEAAMLSFKDLGTAWSEIAAPRLVRSPSRLALHLGGRPAWGPAVVATVTACVMAVGLNVHNNHLQGAGAAQVSASASPSNAELAEDNELMQSIDEALQYRAAPAVPAAMLREDARHREGQFSPAVAN